MIGRALIFVAAGVGGLFPALPAGGARKPAVIVLPFQPAQSEVSGLVAQRVTDLVIAELRREGRLEIVEASSLSRATAAPVAASTAASEALRMAERLYSDARAKVQQQEFEEASKMLALAVQRVEENIGTFSDYGLLADVHLWHGIALFRAGHEAEGQDALTRALLVRPDLALDPKRYPPLFRRIVEELRTRLRQAPRAGLRVESTPAGCEVLVNGLLRGKTPAEMQDLPVGRHYVRVACAGFEPEASARDLRGGGTTTVAFSPAPARVPVMPQDGLPRLFERLRTGALDAEASALLQGVMIRGLADYGVVGSFVRDGDALVLRAFVQGSQETRLAPLPPIRFDLELLNAGAGTAALARAVEKVVGSVPRAVARTREDFRARAESRELGSAGDLAEADRRLRQEELERLAREERERRLGTLSLTEPPAGEGAKAERPFYKSWWFWSVIGVVVTGGIAGAAAGARSGGAGASIDVRWSPR